MACEAELIVVKRPDVDLVYFFYTFDFLEPRPNLVNIQVRGCCLKDQGDTLHERLLCRPEHNYCEKISADRVHPPELGPEEDYSCCNYHTNGVKQIAKDVKYGCVNI